MSVRSVLTDIFYRMLQNDDVCQVDNQAFLGCFVAFSINKCYNYYNKKKGAPLEGECSLERAEACLDEKEVYLYPFVVCLSFDRSYCL